MNNKIARILTKSFSVVLAAAISLSGFSVPVNAQANTDADPFIVVSLGDSYSSGEGIEPFYGQNKPLADKVKDQDWLAHRSTKSWPALLEIPGLQGKMSDYKVDNAVTSANCQWYFKAASGAETKHFNKVTQEKKVRKKGVYNHKEHLEYLPKQLDVFQSIEGDVDYVTLTIGGNDVGFADIITTCATGSTYLGSKKLEKQMDSIWAEFDKTEANIKQVYEDIQGAAGSQAAIIVAGYPKLLDKEGKGFLISKKEATIVNDNVSRFNDRLEAIVKQCQDAGINIYFVDVEAEFDKDGGHQAYSSDAWINKIDLLANAEDLDDRSIASAYSIHPNELGAKAYARCVNRAIQEIENNKTGILSGRIIEASDQAVPVGNATISVYKDDLPYTFASTDADGNYSLTLPTDDYRIEIAAPGYRSFTTDVTVTKNNDINVEEILLVPEAETETEKLNNIINTDADISLVDPDVTSISDGDAVSADYGEISE